MRTVDAVFNEYFDGKYPEGSLGTVPIMRQAYKEIAYDAWIMALSATGIQFVAKNRSDGTSVDFFFPE